MKRLAMGLAAVVVIILSSAPGSAADEKADPAEEKAIRERNEAFVAAFNRGDIKAMAATYAPDADFLSAEGKRVMGRADLEKYFAKGFAEKKGLQLKHSDSSIRFLKPDVAIDVGTWEITDRADGKAAKGFYTAVWMKHDGTWLVVHDRPMIPVLPPKP
jgi:uncharacterized protein (TIGR02246 family)